MPKYKVEITVGRIAILLYSILFRSERELKIQALKYGIDRLQVPIEQKNNNMNFDRNEGWDKG